MASKRNRHAGKHPSYDKRKMSSAAIKRKKEYDKKYSSREDMKKYRAELNAYNKKHGKVGDGMDASHRGGKIAGFEKMSRNRSRKKSNPVTYKIKRVR